MEQGISQDTWVVVKAASGSYIGRVVFDRHVAPAEVDRANDCLLRNVMEKNMGWLTLEPAYDYVTNLEVRRQPEGMVFSKDHIGLYFDAAIQPLKVRVNVIGGSVIFLNEMTAEDRASYEGLIRMARETAKTAENSRRARNANLVVTDRMPRGNGGGLSGS